VKTRVSLALLLLVGMPCGGCVSGDATPQWGPPEQGFVVALSLDSDRYPSGGNIAGNLACSRLDGPWTTDLTAHPCDARLEVRGIDGRPLDPTAFRDDTAPPSECIIVTAMRLQEQIYQFGPGEIANDSVRITDPSDPCRNLFRPGRYVAVAVWSLGSDVEESWFQVRSRPVPFEVVADPTAKRLAEGN